MQAEKQDLPEEVGDPNWAERAGNPVRQSSKCAGQGSWAELEWSTSISRRVYLGTWGTGCTDSWEGLGWTDRWSRLGLIRWGRPYRSGRRSGTNWSGGLGQPGRWSRSVSSGRPLTSWMRRGRKRHKAISSWAKAMTPKRNVPQQITARPWNTKMNGKD